jgi:hypothetical protein
MKQNLLLLITLLFFVSCKKNEITTEPEAISALPPVEGKMVNLASANSSAIPAGLPKRVAFGIEGDVSQRASFINEADYVYVYLADDIISNGWTKWNWPSGQYASTFMNEIGKMGKIPVFTYYNIVPARYRFQEPATLNLNDTEVMNKYFEDFKLLLQLCKNYGKTVVIHYEPDLFGYMQLFKNDPSKQSIKVSQSYHPDAQGFSNDAKGLAQAIVNMRNKYAPNVLLGWHASQWSTGYDVIGDKHNPEFHAAQTSAYYKSLNANFDLLFSEFSDRDAGLYQLVYGRLNSWWSMEPRADNDFLSDYDRFQRYLKKLNQDLGKKIILWQVPIGNTITASCNSTPGHYKDNRVQYFLQPVMKNGNKTKIAQYGEAGVIAFLFGWGANDCTTYLDLKGDGVTAYNEPSDDDGGYLRKGIKAYYRKGPVALP